MARDAARGENGVSGLEGISFAVGCCLRDERRLG